MHSIFQASVGIDIRLYFANTRYPIWSFSVRYQIIPIWDWTLKSDIGLAHLIGLIRYPIIRLIDRYHTYYKNYPYSHHWCMRWKMKIPANTHIFQISKLDIARNVSTISEITLDWLCHSPISEWSVLGLIPILKYEDSRLSGQLCWCEKLLCSIIPPSGAFQRFFYVNVHLFVNLLQSKKLCWHLEQQTIHDRCCLLRGKTPNFSIISC